jgi:RNA 2',3'-cyclic 3'-phosphodiesterase
MEKIRSFIAVELPAEIKLALADMQSRLKSGGGGRIKWVDPGIMHLTLKFLGNIDTALTGTITAALEEACRGMIPFPIEIGGLGVFPNARRVQVVWVGLKGEVEKLGRLQKNIDTVLAPLGFTAENRPFTPHLTLARVREEAGPEERQALGRLVAATVCESIGNFKVDAVHLMRSQLTRNGPIYTRINSVALK